MSLLLATRAVQEIIGGVIPRDGLIGEWLFSGNALDTSGNGNDGTVNGATLTTDRHSNPNSAYNFSGVSQDITLGDINSVFADKTRMSLSVWFYRGASGTHQNVAFFNNNTNRWLCSWVTDNKIYNLPANGVVSFGNVSKVLTGWHHVVFIYDGNEAVSNDRIKIYLDNVLQPLVYTETIPTTLSNTFAIDSRIGSSGGGGSYSTGKIDDVRLYNRVLTTDEINILFNE